MKALVMVLLLTLVGANVVVPYNNFDTVGYYDYEGVIGPELRIQMSIYVNGEEVKGYYIYEKYRKEIELKGRVEGNAIRLNEYSDGVPCGVFDGTVETVEAWSGTWRSLKTGKQYPLSLSPLIPLSKLNTAIVSGPPAGKEMMISCSLWAPSSNI